ncbi:MAG: alpha/beta fold hydrolase [Stellaceae bacterium]
MSEPIFAPSRAGEGGRLSYWEAGAGDLVVAIIGDGERPTPAHALLAVHRRVLVFAAAADGGAPQQEAGRVGAVVAALSIERFDLLGEGNGAAAALWLALDPEPEIGTIVLVAPAGIPDDAFRYIKQPVLVLCGTNDAPAAGDPYRAVLPDAHFMLVYDAGSAIGSERPEALAFIAREFFERRDLFLVSRESGVALP